MIEKRSFPYVYLTTAIILGAGFVAALSGWHPIVFTVLASVAIFGVGALAINHGWHPQARQPRVPRSGSGPWQRAHSLAETVLANTASTDSRSPVDR